MRFMILVKATVDSEAGKMPSTDLIQAMARYNQELIRAGIMKDGGGLKPTSKAVRVRFSGANRTLTNGPFPNTSDIVAGFWIWDCKSIDEAIDWVKRAPNPMLTDSDIEIRPFFAPEDFHQ